MQNKRLKSRVLSIVMAAAMAVGMGTVTPAMANDTNDAVIKTQASSDDDFTISGGTLTSYDGDENVDVVIPDSVTDIASTAFLMVGLSSVTFPADINVIEYMAFEGCTIDKMIFTGTVPTVDSGAFEGSTVGSIVCPYSQKDYVDDLFETGELEWEDLDDINYTYTVGYEFVSGTEGKTIPDAVKKLCPSAVQCEDGENASVAETTFESVTDGTGIWTFTGWDKTTASVSGADVKFTGTWTWAENVAPKHAVNYSFKSEKETMELPESVTSQLPAATEASEGVAVTPSSSSFTSVKLENGTWTFAGWDAESKTMGTEDVTFVGTWKWVPAYSFTYTDVEGGKSISGFEVSSDFKSTMFDVVIPATDDDGNKIVAIGNEAFYSSSSKNFIKSVTIGENVKSIGKMAFQYCNNLETINVPAATTDIADGAFRLIGGLENIKVSEDNPSYADIDGVLFSKDKKTLVYYPEARGEETYTVPEGTEVIYDASFVAAPYYGVKSTLKKIVFPSTLKEVQDGAFRSQTALEEAVMPANVTFGTYVYQLCSNVKTITVEEGVTEIPKGTFYGNDSAETINLPSTLKKIGANSFERCSVTSVTLPASLEEIADDAFANTELTTVTIPKNISVLGDRVFYSCDELESVVFEDGSKLTTTGGYVFNYCKALTSVKFAEDANLTEIGEGAFSYCTTLPQITIPETVTTIAGYAFSGDSTLSEITVPTSVTSIGTCAFAYESNLKKITIPASVTSIGSYAFYYSDYVSIYGYAGTTAEKYASDYVITFVYLEPAIKTQPESVTAAEGKTVTMQVAAAGDGATYQWYYKTPNTNIWKKTSVNGNKTSAITMKVNDTRKGYSYRCVVTDANGNAVVSDAAQLFMIENGLDITAQPKNVEVAKGDKVQYTVAATSSAEGDLSYQWYYKAKGSNTWKKTSVKGNKTAAVSLKADDARNGNSYRCVITDSNGCKITSDAVTLVF